MTAIGVFGGTFDPIHYGHLRSAFELLQTLALAEVRFIPCGRPPHRGAPLAADAQRLRMLESATGDEPRFVVDDRELARGGPSYTVDTLASLRNERPAVPLCLIVGMDAFAGMPDWHRAGELLQLAHVVVMKRPGWPLPERGRAGAWLAARRCDDPAELHRRQAGVVHVHPVTQLEVSSTALRELLRAGGDPRFLVPDEVRRIILDTGCYAELEAERRHGI